MAPPKYDMCQEVTHFAMAGHILSNKNTLNIIITIMKSDQVVNNYKYI